MVTALRPPLLAQLFALLPRGLHDRLDAWSQRVAERRIEARRHRGDRPAAPLPPVVTGHALPPHPWRG